MFLIKIYKRPLITLTKQWIKGNLVNFICKAKSVSNQDVLIMVTCPSKIVQWRETMLSKLATFSLHALSRTQIYSLSRERVGPRNIYVADFNFWINQKYGKVFHMEQIYHRL